MRQHGIPGEFWKAIFQPGTPACAWAVALRNKCRTTGARRSSHPTPQKRDVAKCENYMPISLVNVGYKIFAAVLLNRRKDSGAEQRFKSKHGTADAIFLVRRLLERTWAEKNGKLVLLAMDWAKAF